MKAKHFHKVTPYLPVNNLRDTILYYKTQLGFVEDWMYEDAPLPVGGLRRDDLHLIFQQQPDYLKTINTANDSFELLIFVDNVDAIFEEYRTRQLNLVCDIIDRPWGIREFIVQDINGYWLRICEQKTA